MKVNKFFNYLQVLSFQKMEKKSFKEIFLRERKKEKVEFEFIKLNFNFCWQVPPFMKMGKFYSRVISKKASTKGKVNLQIFGLIIQFFLRF